MPPVVENAFVQAVDQCRDAAVRRRDQVGSRRQGQLRNVRCARECAKHGETGESGCDDKGRGNELHQPSSGLGAEQVPGTGLMLQCCLNRRHQLGVRQLQRLVDPGARHGRAQQIRGQLEPLTSHRGRATLADLPHGTAGRRASAGVSHLRRADAGPSARGRDDTAVHQAPVLLASDVDRPVISGGVGTPVTVRPRSPSS